jgi:hypothetical protein
VTYTSLDNKKQLELEHLRKFSRACSNFPAGELIIGETPDFIVNGPVRRVGIEHTLVLIDSHKKHGSVLKKRESAKDNITRLAEKFFQKYEAPEVYVSLFFSRWSELRKRDQEYIAQAVARTVYNNLPSEGQHRYVEYSIGSGQPIEVDLISIFRTTDFGHEHWEWGEAGEVYRNAVDFLKHAIEAKARKITECLSKCDECWLLLVAPSKKPAGFIYPDDLSLRYIYNSAFEQTWFLDDLSGKAARLNTVSAGIRDM